ncbi:MMPL family transporter [Microcella humidisoli]|uniref:MMPL family transporter n=1 Tax=Microcella humidisoli TaxID=2963406 RepID=A0ABY5FTS4_9MICO|nr:MMPL family transporter [Microcella humidisoli]UTT61690.1 MMPL family transporter [Microcella humidisoli]
MATLLYRLGRFSYRRARLVIVAWLVVFAATIGGGLALGGQTDETFSIPGTESQVALDQLNALFPAVSGASAQAVVVAPEGAAVTDAGIRDQIDTLERALIGVDGVDSVLGPFDEFADGQVSDDEAVAIVRVQLDGASSDISEETIAALVATAETVDVRVEFAGQVFQDTTVGLTVSEVLGVLFAGAVLIITFGSLRAAWMPLATALIGVGIVVGAILGLAAFLPVSSSAPLLAVMIGLAVGIDYALFILSRHRGQLARGMDPAESAAVAVGTAGSAVVFAGATVIIALLGLLVVGVPFLSVMGVGAAFAVLIAIAAAVTLLPALLGVAGAKLVPREGSRAWKRAHPDATTAPTMGRRWVRGVMKRPVLTSISVVAVLGVLSIPAFSLDLNLPDGGSEPAGSTQREAYDIIADAFGPGTAGPLLVTLDITQTTDILDDLAAIRGELEQVDGVASVSPGIPSPGLETAIFQVAPETAPDDPATKLVVADLRAAGDAIEEEFGTPLAVTGVTAVGIDISTRLTNALVPFGLVVVGLSVVLLMAVFRSVLVPVKAALGFLLSVGSAMGVTVAVFQWGWGAELLHAEPGPILSFMPIILMAVLFGLAMDYEVFLVSGMREEFVRTGEPRRSIEDGFANGARVVTAAALIMFFVFAAFVPEGSGLIKPIALSLAVGIAIDAFVVRMTLGPALMALFGRAAWWFPRALDRTLPDLDVEGEKLRHHRDHRAWAAEQGDAVIVADRLGFEGTDAQLTLVAGPGTRVDLVGEGATRRLAGATLAGYLPPRSGRAVVADAVLPSEAGRASRRVTLVDVSGDRLAPTVTIAALVSERIALAAGYPRGLRRTRRWIARLTTALASLGVEPLGVADPETAVAALDPRRRALVLAAVATLDATPVIVLDHRDDALTGDDIALLDALVQRLAPAPVVRVWGREPGSPAADGALTVDLDSASTLIERSGA